MDVRTAQEYEADKIEGSLNLPHTDVLEKAQEMFPDKNQHIIVYCGSAKRSAQAQDLFEYLGYTNVYNLGSKRNWETKPVITITGQGTRYKFAGDSIDINYIINQYDTAEVMYSFGENSTIADALVYDSLKIPADAKGDLFVKAYLVYNGEVYAETSKTFKVYAPAQVPDVEPFAYASDDMDNWITATTGWESIRKDLSVDGNKITIAGKTYEKGIGTHAPSYITMNIPDGASRFIAVAGIDDEVTERNRYSTFSVYIDGVLADETLKMQAGMSYLFDIEIPEGAETLTLFTGETTDYRDYDHTD